MRRTRERFSGAGLNTHMATPATALPPSVRERLAAFKGGINVEQVAEILGLSEAMIYKMAKNGLLPHYRIGTSVRFDPRAISEWYDKQVIGYY